MEFKGIDVSRWQGGIDWEKVKASGVQFAMLRSSYGRELDTKFRDNLAGAKAAGLDVGVYHFTTALTPAEAEAEIDWLFGQLNGEPLSYPVAFDMEDEKNRYAGKTAAQLTDIAASALARIEKHGYYAMLYANPDWLENRYEKKRLKPWDLWLAAWRGSRPTAYEHGIWQRTGAGSTPGISGRVDLDIAYKDYPTILRQQGLNGLCKKPAAVPQTPLYSVKKGDTLWGIATAHGTTVHSLAQLNGLENPNLIFPGQTLRLPKGSM